MKKYRLKKDLPDAKAGTEFWFVFHDHQYRATSGISGRIYNQEVDVVENNPEWFEEIKDKKIFHPGDMIRVNDSHWACGGERGFVMSKLTDDTYRLCLERTGVISGVTADQLEPATNFYGYGEKNPAAKWTDEDMRKFAHFFSFQNYDRVPKMHELEHWFKRWKGGLYKSVGEPEPCVFINCTIDRDSYYNRMQAINKECERKEKIQKIIEQLLKIG